MTTEKLSFFRGWSMVVNLGGNGGCQWGRFFLTTLLSLKTKLLTTFIRFPMSQIYYFKCSPQYVSKRTVPIDNLLAPFSKKWEKRTVPFSHFLLFFAFYFLCYFFYFILFGVIFFCEVFY